MNKEYIKPEIRVAMFEVEAIATEEVNIPSGIELDGAAADFLNKNSGSNKVQRSMDFNKAIKFN